VLLSAFGNTPAALALYLPVVTTVIHAGTFLIRPYMVDPRRARAWLYSAMSSVVAGILMFGWAWITLTRIEDNVRMDPLGTFRGWEPDMLWALLRGGWLVGFVVSIVTYSLLTKPDWPETD